MLSGIDLLVVWCMYAIQPMGLSVCQDLQHSPGLVFVVCGATMDGSVTLR